MNGALEVYCCLPKNQRLGVNWRRAAWRVKAFSDAINDLQRGAVPTVRAEAQGATASSSVAPKESIS